MSTFPDLEILDDVDATAMMLAFDPHRWIGHGHSFAAANQSVQLAFSLRLEIPADVLPYFPNRRLPPISAANRNLFPRHQESVGPDNVAELSKYPFMLDSPTLDLASLPITEFQLPHRDTLLAIRDSAGQAWLDGMQAVIFWWSDIAMLCPFWMITAALEIDSIMRAKWPEALAWLESIEWEDKALCDTARRLMGELDGCSGRFIGDLTFEKLAHILGQHKLSGAVIDRLMEILQWNNHDRLESQRTIIATTTLAQAVAHGEFMNPFHADSRTAKPYAKLLSANPPPATLLIPVHVSPSHWASVVVDFEKHIVHYGDSLSRSNGMPPVFRENLLIWLWSLFPDVEFRWEQDLECAVQLDGCSCAIIVANALAHHAVGEPLWTQDRADLWRVDVFCKLAARRIPQMVWL